MDDLVILVALAVWIGLWTARELGWCGVKREQASASARRGRRRPRLRYDGRGGPEGRHVDALESGASSTDR
jgi:hypothetical protein